MTKTRVVGQFRSVDFVTTAVVAEAVAVGAGSYENEQQTNRQLPTIVGK